MDTLDLGHARLLCGDSIDRLFTQWSAGGECALAVLGRHFNLAQLPRRAALRPTGRSCACTHARGGIGAGLLFCARPMCSMGLSPMQVLTLYLTVVSAQTLGAIARSVRTPLGWLPSIAALRTIAIAVVAIVASGCTRGDPDFVPLTKRHSLFFSSPTIAGLVDTTTENLVIDGEVQELGVSGDLIVGRAHEFDSVQDVYFVLHSEGGTLAVFDSIAEVNAYVDQRGIGRVPLRPVAAWK